MHDSVPDGIRADHDRRVAQIAAQLADLSSRGTPAHVAKGGLHHVVPLPGDTRFGGAEVDASALTHILAIDPVAGVAVVEPGVSFETLVRATLPHGLIPTVVPELRGISIGGAVAGCSIESMSFRYGGFHDSCLSYEVVTGRGEVLEVSPDERSDLFHHLHGSYGTLGVLTAVTCRLVPAKPFVEVTYQHLHSFDRFEERLAEVCRVDDETGTSVEGWDLVDGIIHAPDHLVLCLGRFVERAHRPPSDYSGVDIYYRSTEHLASDLLRTEDYCFRYDTECHWLTRTVPPLEWRPVRRLFGRWFLGSTNLITWSNRLGTVLGRIKRRPEVVCDVFIPASRFGAFWAWYQQAFDFWPLWVVPYRPAEVYPWIGPGVRERLDDELFIDLAVYGAPNNAKDRDLSAELEEQVWELGGLKTLIGRNHHDHDRFWQTYDRPAYESAKKQLDPDGVFPDLYDKLGRVE